MLFDPQIGPIEGAFGGFVNIGPVGCRAFLGCKGLTRPFRANKDLSRG